MIYKLDSAIFVLLGNFISSCYTNNWAWQDLLRKPLKFSGTMQQGKLLVFKVPSWLPHNDAILKIPATGIETKFKDLFLPSQIQKGDDSDHILIVDVESLLSAKQKAFEGQLVYWPLFRFVIEPMSYSDSIAPSEYVLRSFDYIMRLSGVIGDLDFDRMTLTTESFTLQVGGSSTFDSITLSEPDGLSAWSLSERRISLFEGRFNLFKSALEAMLGAGVTLERCEIQKVDQGLELRYVG